MSKLAKHEVVVFESKGIEYVGLIEKLTAKTIQIDYETDSELYFIKNKQGTDPNRLISGLKVRPRTSQPIPALLQKEIDAVKGSADTAKATKGDIVAFEYDGKAYTGRVLKGGARPNVTLDAAHSLTISAHELSPASLPESEGALKDWSIGSYGIPQGPHFDAPPYRAKVFFKGKHVLWAGNEGNGGPDFTHANSKANIKYEQQLQEAIDSVLESNNIKTSETLASWVHWDWHIRPTGMPFADYVKK